MEYCDGLDLRKFIKDRKSSNKKIAKDQIYHFILGICEGIKEIHSKKLIHRN